MQPWPPRWTWLAILWLAVVVVHSLDESVQPLHTPQDILGPSSASRRVLAPAAVADHTRRGLLLRESAGKPDADAKASIEGQAVKKAKGDAAAVKKAKGDAAAVKKAKGDAAAVKKAKGEAATATDGARDQAVPKARESMANQTAEDQGPRKKLVRLINTEALDDMVTASGEETQQHYKRLKALANDNDGNASVIEVHSLEAAARNMVKSYLLNSKAQETPEVEEATAEAKSARKAAQRMMRQQQLQKQQLKMYVSKRKQAVEVKRYAKKVRGAAEIVVKESAKNVDSAKQRFVKAKAAEKKARADISKVGQKAVDDAGVSLKVAALGQKLSGLKLKRATTTLKLETDSYLRASKKLDAVDKAIARHGSDEKSSAAKQAGYIKAEKQALKREESTVRKQKRALTQADLKKEKDNANSQLDDLKKQRQNTQKKLEGAVAKAERTGDNNDQMAADELSKDLEDLTQREHRTEKRVASARMTEKKEIQREASADTGRVDKDLSKQQHKLKAVYNELAVSKTGAEQAGRDAQRDLVTAERNKDEKLFEKAKESLTAFQGLESKVKQLQSKAQEKEAEVAKLNQKKSKALHKTSVAMDSVQSEHDRNTVHSIQALDNLVKKTLAKSQKADSRASPLAVAMKSEAISESQSEYDQQQKDATESEKETAALFDARATQKTATKKLSAAISKYMINVRSTAPVKKVAGITLEVQKSITALQDAQVEVEKLKMEQKAALKQMKADSTKIKASVANKLKSLKEKLKPVASKQQEQDSIEGDLKLLNATGPGTRVAEATAKVNRMKTQVKKAQEYFSEVSKQLNMTTRQMKIGKKQDHKQLVEKKKQVEQKVLTAKAKLKVATHNMEDAEMTQVAEEEAERPVSAAKKQAATKSKDKSDEANLDAAATKLATAALSGDASAMSRILNQSMENHTMSLKQPSEQPSEVEQIDSTLTKAANGTNDNADKGFSRQEYHEERLAQESGLIKDKATRQELAETIERIDNPNERGLTKQQFDNTVEKQEGGQVRKTREDVTQLSDDKEGMTREAFESSQDMLFDNKVASLDEGSNQALGDS